VKTVGIVVHHERAEAVDVARAAVAWLEQRGHAVRLPKPDGELLGRGEIGVDAEAFGPGLDLAVSVGGDGTMLRTVELAARHDVPVFGVNMGRLGYLTEAEPTDLSRALERWERGDFAIERRMTLAVDIESASGSVPAGTQFGLNEAVVEKPSAGHTVHVAVWIAGEFFTTYAADGLIVATPTGSTAYAFSARGPILAPAHRALVVNPVSAHMLFDRALVLDEADTVRIEVVEGRPAVLTVDGRDLGTLRDGDAIVCRAAPHDARFVIFEPRRFYRILKAKFGLADR
jgi:NAD+ kinase